jgi:hypothetical protein
MGQLWKPRYYTRASQATARLQKVTREKRGKNTFDKSAKKKKGKKRREGGRGERRKKKKKKLKPCTRSCK